MSGQRPPILLILDLNGTLLERLTDSVEKKAARDNPHCPEEPDFVLNGASRPYLDAFLHEIFRNFAVAAWTSATARNAPFMIDQVFGSHARHLAFGWSRERCSGIEGRQGGYVARKDLNAVWSDPDVNFYGGWNEANTILIDDTLEKASYTPANGLHLPPFTVMDASYDPMADTALLSLIKYLRDLHTADPYDVRHYMSTTPAFRMSAPTRGRPSVATTPYEPYALYPDTEAYDHWLLTEFPSQRHPAPKPEKTKPKWTAEQRATRNEERRAKWEASRGLAALIPGAQVVAGTVSAHPRQQKERRLSATTQPSERYHHTSAADGDVGEGFIPLGDEEGEEKKILPQKKNRWKKKAARNTDSASPRREDRDTERSHPRETSSYPKDRKERSRPRESYSHSKDRDKVEDHRPRRR
ncbi:hypothetical protein HKX48_004373 [Thoreauomyces humboldtii]|nr:hypothetical protein HKX48_004373 [Thoreauomyces humboldtii]